MKHLQAYFGASDRYWESIGDSGRALYALIRPVPKGKYEVDVFLWQLRNYFEGHVKDGGQLELCPDFQRGHVWTEVQRSRYVEAFIRGAAPTLLQFNCPSYGDPLANTDSDMPRDLMVCVDGLQRFTALTDFVDDKVEVFGGMRCKDFAGSPFDVKRMMVKVRVHGFVIRADLLQFYLDINSGGTVHPEEELERVRELLQRSTQPTQPVSPSPPSRRPRVK